MNLSKELKKRRDSEERLRNSSPQVKYIEGTGYIDLSKLATKAELEDKADINHQHTFLDLTDTPDAFVADKMVKVNSFGTALVFSDAPSGASGSFSYGKITDITTSSLSYGGLS